MAEKSASASPEPALKSEIEGDAKIATESSMTDDQWRSVKSIIDFIYNYRDKDGHDPSKVFHRKVNKRAIPDYYDVIKEPVALSTLKAKLLQHSYKSYAEFVRDCALISHNAQTYNRPEAGAYQDALVIRDLFVKEFQKLVNQKIISEEEATMPDLGEIPPASPLRPLEEQDEEEDDDDDDEDDDEAEESDEEGGKKKKRGRRPKRERGDAEKGDGDPRKRRGRPPRVDTPMEARIKAVLKGIRKYKNETGQIMIHQFEKLPDKASLPDYYVEIKEPIAIELIKRKQKRKKYQSMDHFLRDMNLVFENAKSYNQDESQIYKDAVYLQDETHKLVEAEMKKPDTEFLMEEGRLPLPNGILHNSELWKVGDWVHIQNPNDVTKPIVAQLYRTWQDSEGQKWVNACWYYRPEQTVHQYEKHFYPNEVVKTGQYRDHRIEEVIDRCFVMFCTRYSRGRPRGLPSDKEVYVCDSRYNEEKFKLNKIKTWASCLPDEVRDKDYEMDLFEAQRRVKKVPSPLLHLLPDDAKETDEPPKPRWGVENAPPTVGGIFKGPREENQSPPPESTPSPPPQAPLPTVRPQSTHDTPSSRKSSEVNTAMASSTANRPSPLPIQSRGAAASTYNPSANSQSHQHSISPAPIPNSSSSYAHTPSTSSQSHPNNIHLPNSQSSRYDPHSTTPQASSRQSYHTTNPPPSTNALGTKSNNVWMLSEHANAAIPPEIREQFQCDKKGHVLFFTTPPLDATAAQQQQLKPVTPIGHSTKYLAEKMRRKLAIREKRKAAGVLPDEAAAEEELEEDDFNMQQRTAKRSRTEEIPSSSTKLSTSSSPSEDLHQQIHSLHQKALNVWVQQLNDGTQAIYKDIFGVEDLQAGMAHQRERLSQMQDEDRKLRERCAGNEAKRRERQMVGWGGEVFLDDWGGMY